jgi:hypothetical protein
MTVIDVTLTEDDGIEVVRSDGELVDADDYYKSPLAGMRPECDIQGILSVNYIRNRFDKDGIEMENTEYFKTGVLVEENLFRIEDIFEEKLLSEGILKPVFLKNQTIVPSNSDYGVLIDTRRDENNPAIVYKDKFEIDNNTTKKLYRQEKHEMGLVEDSWPELLRIKDYNIFATKEKLEDEWEVVKESIRGGDRTLDEAISLATEVFNDRLESSNTKFYKFKEYDALRTKCNEALDELNNNRSKQK